MAITNTLPTTGNGAYLLKGFSDLFSYTRPNKLYRLYHKHDGFIVSCKTQRQLRNAVRAYVTKKVKSIKGRE